MSKILQSLPLTVTAGVVLTIIMAFLTDQMSTAPTPSEMMDEAGDQMQDMMH
ncbi:MAG: hypothetical protein H3C28_15020 [Sphingomonadales bacterium]|nr:hypothetical protein [Sphingomonadales bacterium]